MSPDDDEHNNKINSPNTQKSDQNGYVDKYNDLNSNINRRNSDTNVLSPLLKPPPRYDDKLQSNEGINGKQLFSPEETNWQNSEDSLRNGLGLNGNNNGSHELMNGKGKIILPNGKNHEKLTDGLYRANKKKSYDDGSNSDSYGNSSNSSYIDDDNVCGLFGFHPKWAQQFASTHTFMVVFLLAWILQGMYLTYFVSIITTIEKLFQIKSRTTGMLLSTSEIGQISTAMLLTYYAGRGHRPRWIASGMLLFSVAAFCCALPHFIFGDQLMKSVMLHNGGKTISQLTQQNFINHSGNLGLDNYNNSINSQFDSLNLCLLSNNETGFEAIECEEELIQEQASHSKITVIVLCIFVISLLSSSVSQTAVATLGIPYIDDNVASRESPIYLAITIGCRIMGPAAGFVIGSFCTRIFVDLSIPDFDQSDPRWISAWWLGPILIGSMMMLASIAMFSFPKQLRGKRATSPASLNSDEPKPPMEEDEKPQLKDFPKTVRRLLSNDILMFRTASSVFHILPIAGLYTFLPKYLETQFGLQAADAALSTSFGGILIMGVGIMISGIIILRANPSAKTVAGWIAFTALMYSLGMALLMFVGCNMDDFSGIAQVRENINTNPVFVPPCNLTCTCDLNEYSPICGADKKTYFSSCHAGCSVADFKNGKPVYKDCECIPDIEDESGVKMIEAVSGYCDTKCKNFVYFILLFAFCVFIHSTSEVGSMLVIIRCTDPKDKAMAMGVIQSASGLFGNVPCPIIYGAVIDSACLVWRTVCGKHGACSLYDTDTFRHYFLGITSGIMFVAFIMDLIVWKKAHRIDIAPEKTTANQNTPGKQINSPDTSV